MRVSLRNVMKATKQCETDESGFKCPFLLIRINYLFSVYFFDRQIQTTIAR
jgi:hypothetical protein